MLDNIGQGQGIYLYSYWSDRVIDRETVSVGVVPPRNDAVETAGRDWVQIDLSSHQGEHLVGNPFLKIVNFADINVCGNGATFSESGGCSGGTQNLFEAAASGDCSTWINSTIYYYANESTRSSMSCSSGCTDVVMKPWWSYWIEVCPSAPADIFLAVPQPATP